MIAHFARVLEAPKWKQNATQTHQTSQGLQITTEQMEENATNRLGDSVGPTYRVSSAGSFVGDFVLAPKKAEKCKQTPVLGG